MPRADRNIVESSLQTPFVLTFDSCKGLEFDIVIIPYFEKAEWALTNQRTRTDSNGNEVRETNADGTPKMWATPNHYYVACTRARSRLYVLYNQKPRIMNFYNPNSILASADFSASSPADSATDDDLPF